MLHEFQWGWRPSSEQPRFGPALDALEPRLAATALSGTVNVIAPDGTIQSFNCPSGYSYDATSFAWTNYVTNGGGQASAASAAAAQFGSDSATGLSYCDGTTAYLGGSVADGEQMVSDVQTLDNTFSAAISDTTVSYGSNDTDPATTAGQAYADAITLLNRNVQIADRLKVIAGDITSAQTAPQGTLIKWLYYRNEVRSLTQEASSNLSKLSDLATRFPNVCPGLPPGTIR